MPDEPDTLPTLEERFPKRVTAQITEEAHARLRRIALARQVSLATVYRWALLDFAEREDQPDDVLPLRPSK